MRSPPGEAAQRRTAHFRSPPRRAAPTRRTSRPRSRCFVVVADDALDVVGQPGGGHLQAADLAAEPARAPSAPPRWIWKPSTCLPSSSSDELALQADVGDLDAGAGVRAAVHVDGDRLVEVRQPLLQLVDQLRGRGALVSTIASLQYSMPVHAIVLPPERRGADLEVELRQLGDERLDLVLGHVEDHHLLLDGGPHPARAVRSTRSATGRAASPFTRPTRRGEADVVLAVLLPVHADVVARGRAGAAGAGPSGSVQPRYSFSSTSRNFSAPQSFDQELQPGAVRSRRYP